MQDAKLNVLIDRCFGDPEDRDYLERFCEEFWGHLFAFLVSISPDHPELAEDAIQQAFLKYLEIFRAGRTDGIDYLPYFVAIARNCLRDLYRSQHRLQSSEELDLESLLGGPPADETQRQEQRILLIQLLMRLKPRCQYLLSRWYITGMDPEELAPALGIQPSSIYMTLKRCRKELAELWVAR